MLNFKKKKKIISFRLNDSIFNAQLKCAIHDLDYDKIIGFFTGTNNRKLVIDEENIEMFMNDVERALRC